MPPITFTLNGAARTVDAPPDMPLLWVLRDLLDLEGTKFGCGISECGACTVRLNGRTTRSSPATGRRLRSLPISRHDLSWA